MPRKTPFLVALILLIATFAAAGVTTASDAATNPTFPYVIVSHNVEHKGFGVGYGDPDTPGRAIDHALSAQSYQNADGLLLQEVCSDQAQKLLADHAGQWSMNYHPIGIPIASCGTDAAGDPNPIGEFVAWTGGTNGVRSSYDLVQGDGKAGPDGTAYDGPGLSCETYTQQVKFRMCSVHLPATEDDSAYISAIKAYASTWMQQGYEVLIGGDFNQTPSDPDLDALYHLGSASSGSLSDADGFNANNQAVRGGSQIKTHFDRCVSAKRDMPFENKIDYVFASINRVPDTRPRSEKANYSTKVRQDYDCPAYFGIEGDSGYSDQSSDHYVIVATFAIGLG